MQILFVTIALLVSMLLIRLWSGVMNMKTVDRQTLASVEKHHLFLPSQTMMMIAGIVTVGLIGITFARSSLSIAAVFGLGNQVSITRTVVVFLAIAAFGIFDQLRWRGAKDRYRYFFAFVLGTVVTWILISFKRAFFETGIGQDPFLMALGITCVVIGWKFLFGPWNVSMKATVLGTFIFWVTYAMLRGKTHDEMIATGLAAAVAIVPVVIWCALFLSYHVQRLSVVVLAFFAGMLSTAPILFYDALQRHSIELNFFLFKIVPLNFSGSANDFVAGGLLSSPTGTSATIIATLITYLIVGIIEEASKYWVLRHSSDSFFRSIDDVLQLAIVVAIGFAFAENLENPHYFIGFVQNYLITPQQPMWTPFLGNVIGRSILTNMVHILSTGVLGYFFGLAFFASPLLRKQFADGNRHPVIAFVHRLLSLPIESVFYRYNIIRGLLCAFVIHGIFDFIVSLPDVLPGRPTTLGAVLGQSSDSVLHAVPLTLIPSILYVVGGLWLLGYLFQRQEDMKEFGAVATTRIIVS